MDGDNVEILDEPPKPQSKCDLRYAIWLLNTLNFFVENKHVNEPRKNKKHSRDRTKILRRGSEKRQELITGYSTKRTIHWFCSADLP